MPSGFDFLDRDTGGLRPSKRYVLIGRQGTERHVAALQMTRAGLDNGEVVLLLAAEDPEAVMIQGERLDLSIARFLHSDQLIVLGYDSKFGELVSNPQAQAKLLEDLQRKTNNRPINRVILLDDPVGLRTNIKVQQALERLETYLVDEHRAMIIHVTSDPEAEGARFAELVQTAFGVFEVSSSRVDGEYRGVFKVEKEPTFIEGSVEFTTRIEAGTGFIQVRAREQIPVHYFSEDSKMLAELTASLGTQFDVRGHLIEESVPTSVGDPERPKIIVVELSDKDSSSRKTVRLIEDIRQVSAAPLLVLTPTAGRTSDRVSFLRHGADDVLHHTTSLIEVRERIRRQAVRRHLVPPVTPDYLRLEAGADLPKSGEQGEVHWGIFKENLAKTIDAMCNFGGHFGMIGLTVKDTDPHGAPQVAAGVMRKLTQELGLVLRGEDSCSIAPDGTLVARLHAAEGREIEAALKRAVTRFTASRVADDVDVEIAVSTVVFPHDGGTAEELLGQLYRPERRRVLSISGSRETTKKVERGRLDR